jgi:hypothetical protein
MRRFAFLTAMAAPLLLTACGNATSESGSTTPVIGVSEATQETVQTILVAGDVPGGRTNDLVDDVDPGTLSEMRGEMDEEFLDSVGDLLSRAQEEALLAWHDEIDLVDLVLAVVSDPKVADALRQAGHHPDIDAVRDDRYQGPPVRTGPPDGTQGLVAGPGGEIKVSALLQRALDSCSGTWPVPYADMLTCLLQKAFQFDSAVPDALSRMKLGLEEVIRALRGVG